MATISKSDGDLATDFTKEKFCSVRSPRITWSFNLGLFAFQSSIGLFKFLFVSGKDHEVAPIGIVVTCFLDLLRVVVQVLITAWLVEASWKRLVPSITGFRPIVLREAVAIVLIIGILFGL